MLDAFDVPASFKRSTVSAEGFGLGLRASADHAVFRSPQGNFALAQTGAFALGPARSASRLRALYEEHGCRLGRCIPSPHAIALWDGRQQSLRLFRDGLGLEPLLWAWSEHPRMLLFASEAKAILGSGLVQPRFDRRSILDVFSIGHPVPPRTMFAGIRVLPPGSCLSLSRQGVFQISAESTFASLRPPEPFAPVRTIADSVAQSFQELEHLESGLVLGSGPSDTCLVSLHQSVRGSSRTRTYSGRFEASFRDEHADQVDRVVSELATEHAETVFRPLQKSTLSKLVRSIEAPSLDLAPMYRAQLYEGAASDGRKLLYSATGADFSAGSVTHLVPESPPGLAGRLWRRFIYRGRPGMARAVLKTGRFRRSFRRRWGVAPDGVAAWVETAHVADGLFERPLGPPGLGRIPHEVEAPPLFLEGEFQRRRAIELQLGLLFNQIWVETRTAHHHGLVLAFPFLSREMVSLGVSRPPDRPLAWVRSAMPKPLQDLSRSTRPFRVPQALWPFGPGVSSWVKETLREENLARIGGVHLEGVRQSLLRLETMGRPRIDRIEARVLRALLGLCILGEEFGIESSTG